MLSATTFDGGRHFAGQLALKEKWAGRIVRKIWRPSHGIAPSPLALITTFAVASRTTWNSHSSTTMESSWNLTTGSPLTTGTI